MANYEGYVLGGWNTAVATRHSALLDRYPHPGVVKIEDVTGQGGARIPPSPNLCCWRIECVPATALAISKDVDFAVLASRQLFDRWYRTPDGNYIGLDAGDPEPAIELGYTFASQDDVSWRLTKAMRTALYTWLRAKSLTVAQAHAIVLDQTSGDLNARDIITLARAWLKARAAA